MARTHDFRVWPVATNFSLGPDVSFGGETEVGRAAEPAASLENDPSATSGGFRSPFQGASFSRYDGSILECRGWQ